ncbi:alpha/beta hydrolase fold domain-containing protein [Streptomyces olivaceoviridis]|uniref:alpha/beta hydrolase fold domain-containing protein n=1 Tax=Streptomyces olivaceoviridis TaxID=1921 RepID=UPI0037A7CE43
MTVDLWLPEEAAVPVPVVVFVHGRAWRTGLRNDFGPRFRSWQPGPFARLARAGFAVACPDYRLSGEVSYPAQTDDLTAALAWLHTRADDLGPDTPRTVLWGESAGGHLAALTALTALTHPARTITATVTWYAATDLPKLAEDRPKGAYDPKDRDSFEALLLGGAPAERAEAARDASPVIHVGPKAPPFLLLHGVADPDPGPSVRAPRPGLARRRAPPRPAPPGRRRPSLGGPVRAGRRRLLRPHRGLRPPLHA